MKEGWTYKKLGEVCYKITDGSHNPPKGIEHSDNVMLSSQNVQNGFLDMSAVRYLSDADFEIENKRTNASKGDVLLTIVGTIGRTCVLKGNEGNITFQRSVAILKPKEEIMSRYLMFFLMSCNSKLNSTAQGAAQKGIYLKQLGNITLHYPSIDEQQRIVERLDSAFENIDKLKANAEKQIAEAQTLFQKSLAKAMEPKEGWKEKKMSEIYDVRDGTHDSPKYHETGFPLVTSKNLRGGILDMSNVNFISESDYNAINQRSKVDVGDVLFAMIGTIGNPVYVEKEPGYAIKNMALFKVPEYHSGKFLKYYLQNEVVLSKMQEEAKGTTQKFVSLGYLRNSIISIPPLDEQQRIVERLDSLSENIRKYEEIQRQIISECDALKQALLRKVFE